MTPHGISVVIPVFNTERYVAAAINSVLGQKLLPDEVIVVNDGSTDGTGAVLAGYGDRITVITQPNRGIAGANNCGVAAASGSFLCFLDADDLWAPDKLEKQIAWMTEHPETEIVFGHLRQFISEDLDEKAKSRLICPQEPQPGFMKITMMIRRAAFDRVGAFDERLRNGDFIDWYSRARDHRLGVYVLPDVVALRRLHSDNTGIRERSEQRRHYTEVLKRTLDRRRSTHR